MSQTHFLIGKFFALLAIFSILLSGCASPTPSVAPTIDPATFVAQAVETLSAQITDEALRNPSPTATLAPSATPVPPTATATFAPPTATVTPAVTSTPTATQAPALLAQFLYGATYPENKRVYVPNEEFGLALGFQNTGSVTWEQGYTLKIVDFEGEITVQQEAVMGKAVAPGEKYEFNLWAFGSETLGQHVWYFQMYTAAGGPVPGGMGVFRYESE